MVIDRHSSKQRVLSVHTQADRTMFSWSSLSWLGRMGRNTPKISILLDLLDLFCEIDDLKWYCACDMLTSLSHYNILRRYFGKKGNYYFWWLHAISTHQSSESILFYLWKTAGPLDLAGPLLFLAAAGMDMVTQHEGGNQLTSVIHIQGFKK